MKLEEARKVAFTAKEIDKEEYMRIHRMYALMIRAVNEVFSKADY